MKHVFAALALSFLVGDPVAQVNAQERREIPHFRTYGSTTPALARGIEQVLTAYQTAWTRQDVDALMALHVDDTEWINAFARMFQHRDALGRFLAEQIFPSFDPGLAEEEVGALELISIRYLGEDAAVVHGYTLSNRRASTRPGLEPRQTHFHLVLERIECRWLIVHTVIMDAR